MTPPPFNPNTATIAELVHHIKTTYHTSNRELAALIGRSEKLIRNLHHGKTPGENYRRTLTELYNTGTITHLTPRRRTKYGTLSRIRTKAGAKTPSTTPTDTRGGRAPNKTRGRYKHTTQLLANGQRIHTTEMPPSPRAKGRAQGFKTVHDTRIKITRSQAHADKRVTPTITVQDPNGNRRILRIGTKDGYHASDILTDINHDHHGNTEAWAQQQLTHVYGSDNSKIVTITLNEYTAQRTKAQRKQQDATGTRRRTWNAYKTAHKSKKKP
mgnify:FL=1